MTIDDLIEMENPKLAIELSTDAELRRMLIDQRVEEWVDSLHDLSTRDWREFVVDYLTETHRGYNDYSREEIVAEISEIVTEAKEWGDGQK